MPHPNLLIIGAQKCGTTWLHHVLKKSSYFWGSTPKELNHWNRVNASIEGYAKYFEDADSNAKYLFESTPHYFRLPGQKIDTARQIREGLGDIPLILLLRDPVERYLSAYTHHMMQGRLENPAVLKTASSEFRMVELGFYSKILAHFDTHFSNINIYLYDDIKNAPYETIKRVFGDLSLQVDLTKDNLAIRPNDKKNKMRKLGLTKLPKLSAQLKTELRAIYREDIERLEIRIQRDLSSWLR
jgi:hypothetical protein